MRPYIVIGIYILVPLLISWLYKISNIKDQIILTHFVTAILILIYPYFIMEYDNWINPPDPEKFSCGMPMVGLYIGNTIFMIPITQGLLYLFNWGFKNYSFQRKPKQNIPESDLS